MSTVKSAHIPTLLELLWLGAKDNPVKISTGELARKIGKSQQAASRHLLELIQDGYLERVAIGSGQGIRLTDKGVQSMLGIFTQLKGTFEPEASKFDFTGEVFSGLGEGAYYVSLKGYRKQFIRKLGFDPFPGTLNIRLTSPTERARRRDLTHYPGIRIDGYEDEQRTYGWVKCLHATVNDSIDGVVFTAFERTHYDDSVLEVLAPVKLRDKLNLKDGDRVHLRIKLPTGPEQSSETTGG